MTGRKSSGRCRYPGVRPGTTGLHDSCLPFRAHRTFGGGLQKWLVDHCKRTLQCGRACAPTERHHCRLRFCDTWRFFGNVLTKRECWVNKKNRWNVGGVDVGET